MGLTVPDREWRPSNGKHPKVHTLCAQPPRVTFKKEPLLERVNRHNGRRGFSGSDKLKSIRKRLILLFLFKKLARSYLTANVAICLERLPLQIWRRK